MFNNNWKVSKQLTQHKNMFHFAEYILEQKFTP